MAFFTNTIPPNHSQFCQVDLQMLIDTYMTIFLVGSDMNASSVAEVGDKLRVARWAITGGYTNIDI